jgi:DNA polymerase-3 subunit delta
MDISYFDFIKKPDISEYKLFIVTGDEPLQRYNVINKITQSFKKNGFEISRHDLTEPDHSIMYHEADSMSLFTEDKLIQYNLEKAPLKSLQKALVENMTKDSDNVYLLAFSNLKRPSLKTKWFQSIAQNSVHINVYQPDINAAIRIIKLELADTKVDLSDNAVQLLAQKTEGNLIATKQIIRLLSNQDTLHFDEETIRPFLHEHTNFDVYDLSDAILMQQKAKALTILNSILNEGNKYPLILWTLKRELRILSQLEASQDSYGQKVFKENNIWASKQKYYSSLSQKITPQIIADNLKKCLEVDLCIKGAKKGNIHLKLNEIVFKLLNL